MQIVFLPSAARDIAWFRQYYTAVFPAGSAKARAQLQRLQQNLAANPYLGRPSESHDDVREIHLSRTPFTLIYRVGPNQIEILRLFDTRQGATY